MASEDVAPETGRPAAAPDGQMRAGAVVFAALITQLVVIAAACNQWVAVRIADQVQNSIINGGSAGVRDLKATLLTYNWRLAPQAGDTEHSWLGQMMMIATVLVVSGILISVVVRGPASFARALFACWTAVIVATMVGTYVRGLITETSGSSLRITRAVFGALSPGPVVFFAALVLGFVTGVVAGIVAVATRTAPAPAAAPVVRAEAPYAPPEQPEPFFGGSAVPPWQEQRYEPHARQAPPPHPDQPTTRLNQGDQPTTAFPRPPDDDELGHLR